MSTRRGNAEKNVEVFRRLGTDAEAAFEEIYVRYHAKLSTYLLLSFSLDAYTIEGIVEETFIRIWATAEAVARKDDPERWMYKIARYKALDAVAKQGKRRTDILEESIEWLEETTPESKMLDKELWTRIEAAADTLPAKEREIFYLSKQQGMSNAELVQHLRISPQSVRNRLSSALKKIRQCLADAEQQ